VCVKAPPLLVAIATCATLVACGGSSAYDKAWVAREVGTRAGSNARVVEAPDREHPFVPSLPKGVTATTALTEDDAVAVALWNSAQLQAELAQLGFSRADLADAAALPNPNLSFLFPMGTRQLELSAQYPIAALLQRPWRIASAKLDVERTARGLVQSGLDLVRDVRVAWAELEACGRRKELRTRSEGLLKKSADLATSRHDNGEVSALEADLVRAEALAAADLATRAVREERTAAARLRMLLGLAESPLGENLGARTAESAFDEPPAEDALQRRALASRPDLRAAELAVEAAGERGGLEKAKIAQLFARLDAKPVGSGGGPPLLFLPGFTADLPIFSQNPGGRARAQAELERTAWLYLTTRQQIVTEVRLTREELLMAEASSTPWSRSIVPLQEKNVTAALRSYESGADSYLVVLEATRKLVDANLRALELGLEVRRAWARLDRAVGWRPRASGATERIHASR